MVRKAHMVVEVHLPLQKKKKHTHTQFGPGSLSSQ